MVRRYLVWSFLVVNGMRLMELVNVNTGNVQLSIDWLQMGL